MYILFVLSVLFVVVYFVFSVDAFFMEKIAKQNRLFWLFWKKPKKGDFVLQFSPWKMHRQKKQSTPGRRAQKIKEYGSLRLLIFKTLSLRFLQKNFRHFQFFEKIKKTTNSLFLTQISSNHFLSENRPILNLTFN